MNPSAPKIVFMHIGPDVQLPTLMVRSMRRHNPDAHIVQVSDLGSPRIDATDEIQRRDRRDGNLMLFRMESFAEVATEAPTWFLDTDMLCNRPLLFEGGPSPEAAVCLREFGQDIIFNPGFRGLDFSEYKGRRLAQIYPYIGCATLLQNSDFWRLCLVEYRKLDPKFFIWYGDQEAIRNVVDAARVPIAHLPESRFACLPEHEAADHPPVILHYKGQRKERMLERARREGLL